MTYNQNIIMKMKPARVSLVIAIIITLLKYINIHPQKLIFDFNTYLNNS